MPPIISVSFPPNIEDIRKVLKLSGKEIFTYGHIIFNPEGKTLTPDLIEHEKVHITQQEGQKEAWWTLYLSDPLFRSSQEIPAHQKQYKTAKKYIKDKNRLNDYLIQLSKNLSGDTYGNCLSYSEAYNAIKEEKLFDIKNFIK